MRRLGWVRLNLIPWKTRHGKEDGMDGSLLFAALESGVLCSRSACMSSKGVI